MKKSTTGSVRFRDTVYPQLRISSIAVEQSHRRRRSERDVTGIVRSSLKWSITLPTDCGWQEGRKKLCRKTRRRELPLAGSSAAAVVASVVGVGEWAFATNTTTTHRQGGQHNYIAPCVSLLCQNRRNKEEQHYFWLTTVGEEIRNSPLGGSD